MKKEYHVLLFMALGVLVLASCDRKKIENPCVYYEEPVNGYKVSVVLDRKVIDGKSAWAMIFLSNGSYTAIVSQYVFIGEILDLFGKDYKKALYWSHYYDDTEGPHLDWRTIVSFDDFDFDGEKELAVCGYPRPFRDDVGKHWLDCEDFTFYKLDQDGFTVIHNKAFDALSSGLCRTPYDFDTSNQTLTLIGVESAFESDTTIYYFQNGEVVDVVSTNNVVDEHEEITRIRHE